MSPRRVASFAVAFVLLAATLAGVAAAQSGAASPAGEGGVVDVPAARRRRPAPDAMVLCRGPRGAVYARDVEDGCRNTRLDASTLVDFGGGDACLLRRATTFDPDGAKTSSARTCEDVCNAADGDRSCVVALRRTDDGWNTFSPTESFASGADELRDSTVVCCKR